MKKQIKESLNLLIDNRQLYHYLWLYFGSKKIRRGGLNDYDFYDLDNLLCEHLKENCKVVEIGSWTGMSTVLIGARARQKNGKVYAVDDFSGGSSLAHDVEKFDVRAILIETLVTYNVRPTVDLIVKKSVDASKDFLDNYFDFIFIDANHSDTEVMKDLVSWYPKLKDGGLICGHDYQHDSVKKAVDKFFGKLQIEVKIVDNIREKSPVWYTIKEVKEVEKVKENNE